MNSIGSKILDLKDFIFDREDNVVENIINPLNKSLNDCCSANDGAEIINEEIIVYIRILSLSFNNSRSSLMSR